MGWHNILKTLNERSILLCVYLSVFLLVMVSCTGNVSPVKVSKTNFPEFIIENAEVEVLYRDADVDSVILKYPLIAEVVTSEKALWRIEKAAEQRGWKVIEKNATAVRFARFYWGPAFLSVEDARVILIPESLKIYVAWVQADSREKVARIEDTAEGKWARRILWPKLESYIAEERSRIQKK